MEASLQEIREQQKQSWNKFSPGWKKWDSLNMEFLRPMGEAIVHQLQIHDTDQVLDIAAGTGEPGLSIAGIATNGKVTGTDLSADMLAVARANANARGLTNYEILVADVCELPVTDLSFDAISCRMGFMFFPDMRLAATEMHRVLKTGGRIAAAVWGPPEQNTWVTTIMNVIRKHVELPAPNPDAPGMFRCAAPDLMTDILKEAGFKNVQQSEITGKVEYQGFDQYWQMMMEVGAPIVAAMAGADEFTKALIKKEVALSFQLQNKAGGAVLDYGATILYGEK